MALGFGTVLGAAASDRVSSAAEVVPAQVSIHLWTNRNGEGPSSFGRMIGRGGGVFDIVNNQGNVASTYAFGSISSSVYWRWTRPAASIWVPIGVSVDTALSSNNPTVYQEGVKLTVGSGLTQVGVDTAYDVASTAWCVGNRPSDTLRNWDGMLAEAAIWNVILTDDEFYALQKGVSPDQIRPESLIHYVPMARSGAIDKVAAPWTVTGTAAQPHPRTNRPHRKLRYTPVAAGGPPPPSGGFGFVNVGGSWKTIASTYVNVSGVWKTVSATKVNVGGVWKALA